jgi:hypothetical protein
MSNFLKTNISGYAKDPSTSVVINTNESDLALYLAERGRRKKIKSVESRLEELENTQTEIKNLLNKILERIS